MATNNNKQKESSEKKELIIDIRPWNKELATGALESGVEKIIIPGKMTETAHKLGRITTISEDGDLKLGRDIIEAEIKSMGDEEKIVSLAKNADVIVNASGWKIIPLENLVSKSSNIFAFGKVDEIKTLLGVLEKGVKGVVVKPSSVSDIKKAVQMMKGQSANISLVEAEITNIKIASQGDRSCIDTCTMMHNGEGMLVGSSSNFLFLVNSESVQSEYCATRPFRVNAGAVHSYVLLPGNKTKYLSELEPGDEVLVVNGSGTAKPAIVGRNKIEERPLIVIEAEVHPEKGGKQKIKSSVILQNAETIRLVQPGSKIISVSNLKKGDKVLVRLDSRLACL